MLNISLPRALQQQLHRYKQERRKSAQGPPMICESNIVEAWIGTSLAILLGTKRYVGVAFNRSNVQGDLAFPSAVLYTRGVWSINGLRWKGRNALRGCDVLLARMYGPSAEARHSLQLDISRMLGLARGGTTGAFVILYGPRGQCSLTEHYPTVVWRYSKRKHLPTVGCWQERWAERVARGLLLPVCTH